MLLKHLYRLFQRSLLVIMLIIPFQTLHAETLVIAQLSDRPKKDYKQLRPMVEAVAKRLANQGITGGDVALFNDIPSLIAALKTGKVHWVTETPYTASVLVHEGNARPLLKKWKSGQRHYQSLIYTRKDSDIESINDLRGKKIAFEHRHSFSSYFLPRILLESNGLDLLEVRRNEESQATESLRFKFSRNEKNNLLWVHKGLVDAGTLNDSDWLNPKRVPTSLKQDMKVIYRSTLYPRALELVGPKVSEQLAAALKTTLLSMNNEKDRSILARYERTTGFEELDENIPELLADIYHKSRGWQR